MGAGLCVCVGGWAGGEGFWGASLVTMWGFAVGGTVGSKLLRPSHNPSLRNIYLKSHVGICLYCLYFQVYSVNNGCWKVWLTHNLSSMHMLRTPKQGTPNCLRSPPKSEFSDGSPSILRHPVRESLPSMFQTSTPEIEQLQYGTFRKLG